MRLGHRLFFLTVLAASPALPQTITQVASSSSWGVIYNIAVDAAGNLYAADAERHYVYKIDPFGNMTTIAGTGKPGLSGDGGLAVNAQLNTPLGIALGPDGSLYLGDSVNDRIRRIDQKGIITTYAGSIEGYGGDGGQATDAKINGPSSIVLDAAGNLYFADGRNARIRKIGPNGVITTVAGNGNCEAATVENAPALGAGACPGYLALGLDGSLFFTDDFNDPFYGFPRVRRISPAGIITTIAGDTMTPQYGGDDGPAVAAHFKSPSGIAVDGAGNIYISDAVDARIRRVAPSGVITTYAGTGRTGATGNDGPALQARINFPTGLVTDSQSDLYFYDRGSPRAIRRISPSTVPTIRSSSPVVSSFLGNAGFGSNTYVEIFGSSLTSGASRIWAGADFDGNKAPTKLDGTSVTVNGKPAFIYYLSPGQININTPEDTVTGPVGVQVRTSTGISNIVVVNRTRLAPSLQTTPQFNINGKQYVVALTPDFSSFIGRTGMVAGAAFKPAKPGDSVIIYALGCGPTNPPTQAGVVAAQNSLLALSYQVRIGGVPALVTFAGLLGGTVGLYQFNVVIPNVAPGDQAIDLTIDGVPNAQALLIVVGT